MPETPFLPSRSLQTTNWSFSGGSTGGGGGGSGVDMSFSPDRRVRATLLHRFHFSSHLKVGRAAAGGGREVGS